MSSRWTWVAISIAVLLMAPSMAHADGGVGGQGDETGFVIAGWQNANPSEADGPVSNQTSDSGHWESNPVCSFGGSATCVDVLRCKNGAAAVQWTHYDDAGNETSTYFYCPETGAVIAPPQITNALVLRALRRIDLPASELVVQPPGGKTLVNFETNFYTEQGEFTRTVRLLGQRVELRIWPSQFRWDFGDGASLASASAGAAYPDLEITHNYLSKGRVSPSVDTTYAAEFRVNGGPWRDVTGTVTIPGQPAQLAVTTARPVLVGSH